MEDVVLHFRPGPSDELASLLRRTENLLEPFPCRTPPVFSPWFPSDTSARLRLPIRPKKPPPLIQHEDEVPDKEPIRRCWSVSPHTQAPPTARRHLHCSLAALRLHPLHRVRWVIGQHNCGNTSDLEQVWRSLTVVIRSAVLPSCNAHFQRQQQEIWVFCDLQQSETVGRRLKRALQLTGTIRLCVRKLGHILSL